MNKLKVKPQENGSPGEAALSKPNQEAWSMSSSRAYIHQPPYTQVKALNYYTLMKPISP